MTIVAAAGIAWVGVARAAPQGSCGADSGAYPTFCSIPRAPSKIKSPAAVHREVIDTRLAGRALVQATAPSTFTLDDTAGFDHRAITEAAPPPPVTTPSEGDAEAFAKAAKAAAAPPGRPH